MSDFPVPRIDASPEALAIMFAMAAADGDHERKHVGTLGGGLLGVPVYESRIVPPGTAISINRDGTATVLDLGGTS